MQIQSKENYHGWRTLHNDKSDNLPRRLTILNMYAPKNRASKYAKEQSSELKGEIDTSIIIKSET